MPPLTLSGVLQTAFFYFFFFNDTATTEIYTLSLHDALPIFFVAGVGTGGTITGVGQALKPRLPGLKVVAVAPQLSALLSGRTPSPPPHQGLGAGVTPPPPHRSRLHPALPGGDTRPLRPAGG